MNMQRRARKERLSITPGDFAPVVEMVNGKTRAVDGPTERSRAPDLKGPRKLICISEASRSMNLKDRLRVVLILFG